MAGERAGIYQDGIFRKGEVRLSDLAGRKILPLGNDDFTTLVQSSVFVDKSMLIADVVDGGSTAQLYCRPRRFGKSLNLSMLQRFFEIPSPSDPAAMDAEPLFRGLAIWDAQDGRFREHQRAYPVIRFSFNDVKDLSWDLALQTIRSKVAAEYARHGYLRDSGALAEAERAIVDDFMLQQVSDGDLKRSLVTLSNLLFKHHGARAVILVDEYDAPVMAGYTNGYYDEVVSFLKGWLTGALKSNQALALAVLTGVQRISKESIFSDLNNLVVNTSLSLASDERYGFTQEEIEALAEYLGSEGGLEEARQWYDGYRFGGVDVYNPWSALNYFKSGCVADIYWGNTSGNSVLGAMASSADDRVLKRLYELVEPGGSVEEPLDLSVVFPDSTASPSGLWSMLYLAGHLTTDDTEVPNDPDRLRRLRIPNLEIRKLFQARSSDDSRRSQGDPRADRGTGL